MPLRFSPHCRLKEYMKRLVNSALKRSVLMAFALFLACCGAASAAWSQGTTGAIADAVGSGTNAYAPVKVAGRELFQVSGLGALSAEQRAQKISTRLKTLLDRGEAVRPFTAQDLIRNKNEALITLGGDAIMTVVDGDAQDALMTRDELAMQWGVKMAKAVSEARAAQANPLKGVGMLIANSFRDLLVSVVTWLPRLAGGLILWIMFFFLARLVRRAANAVTSRDAMDSNLRQLIRALAFYGTWVVGMVAILSTLGLNSSGIAAGLGVSGFVLGFAFKDILSHFFAGLMLLLGRQFHIGDQIVVRDFEGTVERIELRALYLRTYDNRLVIIPNGDVFTSVVTSNTASPHRRREFVVGIGYDDDIERAQRVALQTISQVEGVAQEPVPDVLVDELAASTVNLKMRFHTNSQRADYLRVGSECMRRVKEAFDREQISMPTDIQTIFIKNLKEGLAEALADSRSDKSTINAASLSQPVAPHL